MRKNKINIIAVFLLLFPHFIFTGVKFSAEFHDEHPFSKEEMWHPHLKKIIKNENIEITDELNKIYPIQLLQLKSSMLKGKKSPKMSCGCKFVNTITTAPSFIQTKHPKAESFISEKETYENKRVADNKNNKNKINNFRNNRNSDNNIDLNSIPPNLQNIYNLQFGGMIPQYQNQNQNQLSNNANNFNLQAVNGLQGIFNGGGFPQQNNFGLENNYQNNYTKNLMLQNYLLQQNLARNMLIQQYLLSNGLQNNSLMNQAAFGQPNNPFNNFRAPSQQNNNNNVSSNNLQNANVFNPMFNLLNNNNNLSSNNIQNANLLNQRFGQMNYNNQLPFNSLNVNPYGKDLNQLNNNQLFNNGNFPMF